MSLGEIPPLADNSDLFVPHGLSLACISHAFDTCLLWESAIFFLPSMTSSLLGKKTSFSQLQTFSAL